MRKLLFWILVAAAAAIGALALGLVWGHHLAEAPVPEPAMGVVETFVLDDRTVLAVLSEASDLVTIRESYITDGHLTSHKDLWGVTIPFTTDDTYVALHGTIGYGIDLSRVTVEVDDRHQIIYLALPAPQVIFNELEEGDTVSEVLHDSRLTETTMEEYTAFVDGLKREQETLLMNDPAFRTRVTEQTQDVLTELLHKADPTAAYVVIYR